MAIGGRNTYLHKASLPAASPAFAVVAAWSEKPPSVAHRALVWSSSASPRSFIGVSTAKGGTCGQRAGDRGRGERGEGGLAVGELGVAGDAVVLDHALASQEREDARAGDLQHVADVVVGEEGQRVEDELAALVLSEDVVEEEGM